MAADEDEKCTAVEQKENPDEEGEEKAKEECTEATAEPVDEKVIPMVEWKMNDDQKKESLDVPKPIYHNHRILVIISAILLALVLALAVLLAAIEMNPKLPKEKYHGRKDAARKSEYHNEKEDEDEVNFHTLIGTHAGEMRASAPGTYGIEEAVIEYSMTCERRPSPHHSRLTCEIRQIGCTSIREGDMISEECIMDDIGVTFELDRDGNFYADDKDLLDPARLAVALHSRHMRVRGDRDVEEEKTVQKNNATFAIVKCGGLRLEVREMPEEKLKKTHQKRKKRSVTSPLKGKETKRVRRRVPSIEKKLEGMFGEGLKEFWKGGPYFRMDTLIKQKGKKYGIVRYQFSLTNLEILLNSLPDVSVASAKPITTNGATLNLKADFSLGGKCDDVIQSRVKVFLDARACIWRWCFAKVRKDNYVNLNFAPSLDMDLALIIAEGGLKYKFDLKKFETDSDGVLGEIDIKIDIAKKIGGLLLGPVGKLSGFFLNRHLKKIGKKIYDDYKKKVPALLNGKANELIQKNLPKPGFVKVPDALIDILKAYIATASQENLDRITAAISKLTGVLQVIPKEAFIPCNGNGPMKRVNDKCMHDFGRSGGGDNLEIYCINGAYRFCLSKELCPWRNSHSGECASMYNLATCSVAGLRDNRMMLTWGENYGGCKKKCKGWWWRKKCKTQCACSGSRYKVNCNKGIAEKIEQ